MGKTIEDVLESASDADLQLTIEELKNVDDEKVQFNDTMSLCEIHYQISEIWPELDKQTIDILILKEYSYRKAGLK